MSLREYVGLIFAPLALTALLSLIVTLVWHDDIPQSLEAHEWANFTRKIEYALNGEDSTGACPTNFNVCPRAGSRPRPTFRSQSEPLKTVRAQFSVLRRTCSMSELCIISLHANK